MNGDIGFMTIKPDQMQVVNPFLILIFIPLYEVLFYPLLKYVGIRRPLQKLASGGVLAGVAFVISAFIGNTNSNTLPSFNIKPISFTEIALRPTYAVIPGSGEAQLRIFNGMNCQYNIEQNIPNLPTFDINAFSTYQERYQKMDVDSANYNFVFTTTNAACPSTLSKTITMRSGEATSIFLRLNGDLLEAFDYIDSAEKSIDSLPIVRVLANTINHRTIALRDRDGNNQFEGNRTTTQREEIRVSNYDILVDGQKVAEEELRLGGVYTLVLQERTPGAFFVNLQTISDPNTLNML